ncbi:MAG: SRPBCC family protein [Nevskiaceae bacterium]|nr:MAG: SRPBCC family protein [Nevskiaceae bacterium]TBR72023.1 MAG: SRPBCC family protein [Nevskiaceae bacterium]
MGKQLEVRREMKLAASAAKVWALASDFGGIGKWVDVIDTVTITHGGHNAPGTVRHLALKGGGTLDEELMAVDAARRHFRYRIVAGVLPVADYVSDFTVAESGPGASTVTWVGRFKAAGVDDATAEGAIGGVYDGGLAGLKAATGG